LLASLAPCAKSCAMIKSAARTSAFVANTHLLLKAQFSRLLRDASRAAREIPSTEICGLTEGVTKVCVSG
jgi:hypothetical protein